MEELLARMRSLLRRQSAVKEAVLEHRGIKLDLVARTVHLGGEPVDLTSREFALLEIFMQNVGRILSRQLICEKCWSPHSDHEANLMAVYMSRLRAKFEVVPGHPVFKALRAFNALLTSTGQLRVGEFILGPFDVTIATPLNSVREAMRDYSEICIWMLFVMIAISGAIGFGLSRLALRPVRLIRETANHISSDNLSERIPVAAVRDEISELAQLLNQMFDRLESAFDQVRRFSA